MQQGISTHYELWEVDSFFRASEPLISMQRLGHLDFIVHCDRGHLPSSLHTFFGILYLVSLNIYMFKSPSPHSLKMCAS